MISRHGIYASLAFGLFVLLGCVRLCVAASLQGFSLRVADQALQQGSPPNAQLQALCGMTRFAGMVFDRETSDVILVGKVRTDLPPASLDDLVVALRSRLSQRQFPKVSIDMVQETPQTGLQAVRFTGGIENTQFGEDFLRSDVILKQYSLDLLRRIQGLEPYLKLYEDAMRKKLAGQGHPVEKVMWLSAKESKQTIDSYVGKAASESQTIQSRFWFYVMEKDSFIVERDDVFLIEELRLGVKEETMTHEGINGTGKQPHEAQDAVGAAFAAQFTEQFRKAATEHPMLQRLKVLFDLVAIAEGIAHLGENRPPLDHLINRYRVQSIDTPPTYPLVQRLGVFKAQKNVSTLVQLSGGIELEAILLALKDGDVSALRETVLLSRPHPDTLCWTLPLDKWAMPNDEADTKEQQVQVPVASASITPHKLGFAISAQQFIFDPARQRDVALKFNGFPPLRPVGPFDVPDPDLKRLDRMGNQLPKLPSAQLPDRGGVYFKSRSRFFQTDLDKTKQDILENRPSDGSLFWSVPEPR